MTTVPGPMIRVSSQGSASRLCHYGSASVRLTDRSGLVEGGGPTGEQVHRVFRCGAGLGGVRGDPQAFVCGEVRRLERKREVTDDQVMDALDAGAVEAHIVRRPPGYRTSRCGSIAPRSGRTVPGHHILRLRHRGWADLG